MARSARVRAYDHLRRGIEDGSYPTGTWLREEDVALAAGVSRTPVRDALQRLQAEGLVQIQRNRGALVVGWSSQDLDDLYDLRVLLECYGIRRAAARAEHLDLPALDRMCEEMDQLLARSGPATPRLGPLCIEFHLALHRATANRRLLSLLPGVLNPPFVREAFRHHTVGDLRRAFDQHREMLEAIRHGDGDWAEGVMCAHLRAGRISLRTMAQDVATPSVTDLPPMAVAGEPDDLAAG